MNWFNRKAVFFLLVLILVLLNELTLSFFDNNPPLSDRSLKIIRLFDFAVIVFIGMFTTNKAFISSSIFLGHMRLVFLAVFAIVVKLTKRLLALIFGLYRVIQTYVLPVFLAVLILDITLTHRGIGYQSDYEEEYIERYPSPYDVFRGKPNTKDHNRYGFRGVFSNETGTFNIAMFGGSTTYNGEPPIIEIVRRELSSKGIRVNTFNFGSVSSNHSQHVHRLLSFSDKFMFDVVIFYGGGNETLPYIYGDPRPGYPYNYYFREELDYVKKALLRYSSIYSSVDKYSGGGISGLKKLRAEMSSGKWEDDVVSNYWRDLTLAHDITSGIVRPSMCARAMFLSVLQPVNYQRENELSLWSKLISSQAKFNNAWVHEDLSGIHNDVEFTDIVHVTQAARQLIGEKIASILEEKFYAKCRDGSSLN